MEPLPLTRESVQSAQETIAPFIKRTPLMACTSLNQIASTPRTADGLARTQWAGARPPAQPVFRFWFKCENFQHVGAFKARGAIHSVSRIVAEPGFVEGGGLEKGVATHSSGNHAQALAWAARQHKMPAHIVMPRKSNARKTAATRGYGANITVCGTKNEDRDAKCAEVIADTGARMVHAYDNVNTILGAGTVGLEFQEQFAERPLSDNDDKAKTLPDAVMVPCGGGGLLAGIALSCEGTGIQVFGAEPSMSGADDVRLGFLAGKRITKVQSHTVADGLRTPMGELNWGVCYDRKLVKGMYSVSDHEIAFTLRLVLERTKIIAEPSAVVGLAVALFDEDFRTMVEREGGDKGWDVVIVLSGGNVDFDVLSPLLALGEEVCL